MSISITNQKPAVLVPQYNMTIKGDFNAIDYIKQSVINPIYEPINQATPVVINDGKNNLDIQDVANCFIAGFNNITVHQYENTLKDIYSKSLIHFPQKTNLTMTNLFALQSAAKEKMPEPSGTCIYTPDTDIIPMSRAYIVKRCSYDALFASYAFYTRANTLGIMCLTETDFDEFKKYLENEINQISTLLSQDTLNMFNDFYNLTLNGLTESIAIRKTYDDNNEEYSFARTLMAYIMQYTKTVSQQNFALMPFAFNEFICPKSIVFINIDKHAHSSSRAIRKEWEVINKSINAPLRIISNKKLSKLTAMQRSLSSIKAKASAAQSNGMAAARSAHVPFSKTPPTTTDIVKAISKVMKKMVTSNRSENTYKAMKMTFARPNRRDPDDYNKKGKMVSTKYRPDIHLYIDTSGSITERNYQDAVKACIRMAKKLNINLYFNSFSHMMSQCTKLNTKDKSSKEIYKQFERIPKVDGGTDYEQIWKYINASNKRKRELSLIMTDFEYYPPNYYVKHPKNLYYMPISHADYDSIKICAKDYCESMKHIYPNIRSRILF